MRAVKCKDNQLSLINKFETQLYDQAKMLGDLKLIELSERDAYLADEMHKKNIFQKEVKNGCECYTLYSAKQNI
jgi:hypothetical protein|tara:strand:+ start:1999 stop:2220 length:222 start_codon:yes stop_codon:yes gene_type:complete